MPCCFDFLFKQKQKTPAGLTEIPWAKGLWRLPCMGHSVKLLTSLAKDHPSFGLSRLGVIGDVNGLCKIEVIGVGEVVMLQDPDLIKEFFSRSFQAGDVIVKDFESLSGFEVFNQLFGNGLFTAADTDKWWGIAHRILLKSFSRQGMMSLMQLMNEQATLLVKAMKRDNTPGKPIFLYDYTVMMAVETICICALGMSFGSFDTTHPFMTALSEYFVDLTKVQAVPSCCRGNFMKRILKNQKLMQDIVHDIIAKRRRGETHSQSKVSDLLDAMINGVDEETGEKMPDPIIAFNVMTFCLAGQDSTAAAMSSFFCLLSANPGVEAKLVAEIQDVVGDGDMEYHHLSKLRYLDACQKETLRLVPPAPAVIKLVNEDTTFGGKYHAPKGTRLAVNIFGAHLDKRIWGDDAEHFKPERWLEKGAPHPYAYAPFSHGPRACIGREFSLMEQKITITKVIQHFVLRRSATTKPKKGNAVVRVTDKPFQCLNPMYGVDVEYDRFTVFTGCCAPMDVFDRPRLRKSSTTFVAEAAPQASTSLVSFRLAPEQANHGTPLLVLYGSDGGSTTGLAEMLVHTASDLGFKPRMATLNDLAYSSLLQDTSSYVIIVSATYNGMAAANASDFVNWLQDAKTKHKQVFTANFAVFGCGHSDWENTFQAIPTFLDQTIGEVGGHRLLPLHSADSKYDPDGDFASWYNKIWPTLSAAVGMKLDTMDVDATSSLKLPDVTVVKGGKSADASPVVMRFEKFEGWKEQRVLANRELLKIVTGVNESEQDAGGSSTRHLEIELAGDVTYKTGDHLAVHAENARELVQELLELMELPVDTLVSMAGEGGHTKHLLQEVLMRTVDLMKPVSTVCASFLSAKAQCPRDQKALSDLNTEKIQKTKVTVVELLRAHPSLKLSVPELLAVLPPMKPRYYSISSSPLALIGRCSLTVAVVRGTSPTGRLHRGICSNFLAARVTGDKIWVHVKDMGSSFRVPPPEVPLIMVGPGTGLAPFMGFLQELRKRRSNGEKSTVAYLFFGCQTPAKFIYEEELKSFVEDGTLAGLFVAYSRTGERKYVQKDLVLQRDTLWPLLREKGQVFVCGDAARMSPDVKRAMKEVVARAEGGLGVEKANSFIESLCAEDPVAGVKRYHQDVWAAN